MLRSPMGIFIANSKTAFQLNYEIYKLFNNEIKQKQTKTHTKNKYKRFRCLLRLCWFRCYCADSVAMRFAQHLTRVQIRIQCDNNRLLVDRVSATPIALQQMNSDNVAMEHRKQWVLLIETYSKTHTHI